MAFIAADLKLLAQAAGFGLYRYDTLDALIVVDGSGYMNNSDDTINMRTGDEVRVVVWSTAIGDEDDLSEVGLMVVKSVSAAGVVDLTNDLLGATIIDSD